MLEDPKVSEEVEKIRKQNKEILEQWEKEIIDKSDRISIYLLQLGKLLPVTYQLEKEEIDKISVFLAMSVHPNPLRKQFSLPKKQGK